MNFIIVQNTCAGKRMGRHINIQHQNQTAFTNLLNLCDQKFVSVISYNYKLGLRFGCGLEYGLGYGLRLRLGYE